jgi:uncharacterized protein (DUF2235 family)
MAKNIVICIDGTGNMYGDRNSNVVQLYRTIEKGTARQIAYYHPGLGTMGSPNALTSAAKWWTLGLGLAFGYGMSQTLVNTYTFLAEGYEDGDRVYVFGFSRGAYMARVLCAILKMYGLSYPGDKAIVPYLIRFLKSERKKSLHDRLRLAAGFKKTFCRDCPIEFLGLFDTVNSIGWFGNPVVVPFTARNPDIQVVRHAVSLDERRAYFRQLLWHDDTGMQSREVWFPGVHSDIGGGYPEDESALAKIALEWMMREAVRSHLIIDSVKAARILGRDANTDYVKPDPHGQLHVSLHGAWWILEYLPKPYWSGDDQERHWALYRGRPRTIPPGAVIHESFFVRIGDADGRAPKANHSAEPWVPFA